MKDTARMEAGFDGLYALRPERPPFDRSLLLRPFVLQRDAGSLLIYSTDGLQGQAAAVADMGGVVRQYLNHWHEAMFSSERLPVPLFVHEQDSAPTARRTHVDGTFSSPHALDEDFQAIPIPGHTAGATAYLWQSGGDRFLFTGDSVYLRDGEWVAAVLASSDRQSYVQSLEAMRELDFDVLVPWAATDGHPIYAQTDRSDARRRITAILERLHRGEDH
jgi:glyoxylase-like metal-dependent hydrolase (beta-lactamase superfamily II)